MTRPTARGQIDLWARRALQVGAVVLLGQLASLFVGRRIPHMASIDTRIAPALGACLAVVCLSRYWSQSWRTHRARAPMLPLLLAGACSLAALGDLTVAVLAHARPDLPQSDLLHLG